MLNAHSVLYWGDGGDAIDKLHFMQTQARQLMIRAMQEDVLDGAAAHSKAQSLVYRPVLLRGTNEVAPLGQLPPFTSLEPKAALSSAHSHRTAGPAVDPGRRPEGTTQSVRPLGWADTPRKQSGHAVLQPNQTSVDTSGAVRHCLKAG